MKSAAWEADLMIFKSLGYKGHALCDFGIETAFFSLALMFNLLLSQVCLYTTRRFKNSHKFDSGYPEA